VATTYEGKQFINRVMVNTINETKRKTALAIRPPLTKPLNEGNVVFLAGDGEANAAHEIVLGSIRLNLQAHSISNTQTYTPVSPFCIDLNFTGIFSDVLKSISIFDDLSKAYRVIKNRKGETCLQPRRRPDQTVGYPGILS
jgi:hypothetical protein